MPQVDPGNGIVQSDEAPRLVVLFVEDEPLILIDVLDSAERAEQRGHSNFQVFPRALGSFPARSK